MKKHLPLGIITATLLSSATVVGFPFLKSWHEPSDQVRAGGGDIYGTGSAQDWGILCSHCHIDGAGKVDAKLDFAPAFKTVNGQKAYVPGTKYKVTVNMLNEHLGLNQGADNLNGAVVAIENQAGKTAGVYISDNNVRSDKCPSASPAKDPPGSTYVYGDCHGVLFVPHPNITTWTFDWIAPAKSSGDLTLFYGVVDGDANGLSSLDDDVKEGKLKLVEGN